MTTARYIVSSVNAANGSFLDLGIQGRGLTDTGAARDITYVDSEATTPAAIQRVYYRAGMSLNMATSTVSGSNYVVYLDGASTDYTINAATGTITLTADTTQVLTVRMEATTTVVFSDGQLAGNALGSAVSGSGSLGYSGTAGAAQDLRILTGDSAGEAFAIVRSGTSLTASGHRGVDALYVEAGGAADATRLGGGKDVVYLTSNFADYNLSVRGLTLVLQHSTRAAETVYVSMGVAGAATDDRLVFANGAVDSSEIREAYINNAGGANSFTGITTLAHISTQAARAATSVDTAVTTALYTPATPAAPTLTTDTATAADGVTSNGAISAGVRGANADVTDVLQFSTNGGAFQNVPGAGLTLDGQVSGATGVTYAAGAVQLRSVSASGVVSAVSSNANAITVDNTAALPGLNDGTFNALRLSTAAPGTNSVDKALITSAAVTDDFTAEGWFFVETATGSAFQELFFFHTTGSGSTRHGEVWIQNGVYNAWNGATLSSTQTVTTGWHHIAAVRSTSGIEVYVDGVSVISGAVSSLTLPSGALTVSIGGLDTQIGTFNRNFQGLVRDVQLWDSARTLAEVGTDMTTAPAATAAGLVGYYALNEPVGEAAFNAVAGGAAMTLGQGASATTAIGATTTDLTGYTGAGEEVAGANTVISGTGAEIGATIAITATVNAVGTLLTGTQVINADGTWNFTPTNLAPAALTTYAVTATQTDLAGNVSGIATNTRTLTVDPDRPATPDLVLASDTGLDTTDNITNDTTPSFDGTFAAGATAFSLVVTVNTGAATTLSTSGSDGLTFDLAAGTWSYTPATAYANGDSVALRTQVTASAVVRTSNTLTTIIDTTATAPTITSTVPTVVLTSSGDLVISGTTEFGSTALSVTLADGDAGTADLVKAATVTTNLDGTTTWTVTVTQAELAGVTDGTVTLSVAATDRAGNPGALAVNPTFTLELVNSAPVANSGMTDASLARTISVNTTGTILDLLDTDANVLTTGTVDDAFTDADAVGSANGTVTYSGQLITSLGADAAVGGGDDVYGALPGWLEVTAAGVVQVVASQVPLAGVYNLHLTATDGAATPLSATRDVQLTVSAGVALNTALGINQATAATVSDFDLRSDIVFTATGNLTAVTGNSITLHNQADGAVTTGDIVIDAAAAGVVLSYDTGTDTTSIRINPGFDLDVNATYTLSVAAGAFTNAGSELTLAFSTVFASVDPNGADNIAQQFAAGASALSAGATWVDITANGNGASETLAGTTDASTGATVIYAGAATVNAANSFDVNANYFTSVTGFGADDLIYFDDQANGANYGLVSNFDAALSFLQSDSAGDTLAAAPDRNFLGMSGVDGLTQSPTLLVQLAGATTMADSVHGLGANSMETLLGVTPAPVMVA